MKKLFCALLLLFALTLPVFAVGEEISIHPESHWLMMEGDNGLQVLADEYVLDFHWEGQGDTVYYTALEAGQPRLRAVQIGHREGRTVPLELAVSRCQRSCMSLYQLSCQYNAVA